jgi:hypothetical protein
MEILWVVSDINTRRNGQAQPPNCSSFNALREGITCHLNTVTFNSCCGVCVERGLCSKSLDILLRHIERAAFKFNAGLETRINKGNWYRPSNTVQTTSKLEGAVWIQQNSANQPINCYRRKSQGKVSNNEIKAKKFFQQPTCWAQYKRQISKAPVFNRLPYCVRAIMANSDWNSTSLCSLLCGHVTKNCSLQARLKVQARRHWEKHKVYSYMYRKTGLTMRNTYLCT